MNESKESTQPIDIAPEEGKKDPSPKKKRGGIFLAFIIIIAIGALLGYQRGISLRTKEEASQITEVVDEQYSLALFDIEAGRYEIARQRLEYVAELYPGYPGLTETLADVLITLNATATPTPKPTPTPAPTALPVEVVPETTLFSQAEEHLANLDWDQTINTLEQLRKQSPDYRSIDVDGMIYISLRQRGIEKISAGNLEGGIYDLTLAEGFGVLDTEADGWRTWATLYITGASFWEVDWEQAIFYFEQVASMTPNLHDGSGWTAAQRYLEAIIGYAEYWEAQEKWCKAEVQYKAAHAYTEDPAIWDLVVAASEKCLDKKSK